MQNKTEVILLLLLSSVLLIIIIRLYCRLNNEILSNKILGKIIDSLEQVINESHDLNNRMDKCIRWYDWHLIYMIETYAFIRNLSFILKKTDSLDELGCEMDKYHQYLSGAIKSGLKVFPDNYPATRYESVPATLRRFHHSSRWHLKKFFRGLI